jgi:hypothetical protein
MFGLNNVMAVSKKKQLPITCSLLPATSQPDPHGIGMPRQALALRKRGRIRAIGGKGSGIVARNT